MSKPIVTEKLLQSERDFWEAQLPGATAKAGVVTYLKLRNGWWQSSEGPRLDSDQMAELAAPTRGPLDVLPATVDYPLLVEWRRPGVVTEAPQKLGTVVRVTGLGYLVRVVPADVGLDVAQWLLAEGTEVGAARQLEFSDDEVLAYLRDGSGKVAE